MPPENHLENDDDDHYYTEFESGCGSPFEATTGSWKCYWNWINVFAGGLLHLNTYRLHNSSSKFSTHRQRIGVGSRSATHKVII